MQYLLMIYQNEAKAAEGGDAARSAMHEAYRGFTQSIIQSGNFKAGDALQSVSTATTVRVRDGKTLTTDGPFVELKEAVGGYFLLDADNLDTAIEVASRIPAARLGGAIEVRPIEEW